MNKCILILMVLFFGLSADGQVNIKNGSNELVVLVSSKLFTALRMGKEANKPYLYPVLTASGRHVTRGFPMEKIDGEATDHPHQRGVWIGDERLSRINFWENDPADPHPRMGKIVFQRVVETHDGDKSGGFTVLAQWISPEGEPLIDETLAMTVYAALPSRMFDIDLRLKAISLVTFEDHRDGVLGFRFATPFDESHGGKVINANGVQGAKQVEGTHSAWVDWQADLDGEAVGVAVMDHPENFRFPTPWVTRTFGLLFANPFAQRYYNKSLPDGSRSLQPGDELRLRYRVLIHPANVDVAAAFKEYSSQ